MTELSSRRWPGPDEKRIVVEMLQDGNSPHWERCRELMEVLVSNFGATLPAERREDVVQKAMLSVVRDLPSFRFNSQLRTWLLSVAYHRVIDEKRLNRMSSSLSIANSNQLLTYDGYGDETEIDTYIPVVRAAEEECIVEEELREVMAEISAYIDSHAKPERNRKIVDMVLLKGRTLEEAAREVGTSSAVASYIIRSVRRHLQEKFRSEPP